MVGAIDAETLKKELDKLFGGLPQKAGADAGRRRRAEARPAGRRSHYDLPQTTLQLAYPGVARNEPDFFAAYLMNHILGGGDFTSRLFEEVREKRGLAYSVSSQLVNYEHAARW